MPDSTIPWWRPIAHTPADRGVAGATRAHREAAGAIADYPAAFWCLMVFTFIVLVAPQNAYPALRSLSLAFVFGGASLLLLLVRVVARKQLTGRLSREQRLLGTFAVLALLSIPFSLWPGGSWTVFTDLLIKSLFVYVLTAHLLVSPRRFRQHIWLIVVSGIAIAAMALVSFRSGETVEGYRLSGGIAGLTANPNDLALTLNLFLPFGLMLCGSATGVRRLVAAAFVIFSLTAVVFSFSRGGFLTLVTILATFFIRGARRRGVPAPLALLALASLVMLGSFLVPAAYEERMVSIVDHEKDPVGSASGRLFGMGKAVEVVMEHPVLGVGLGQNILALNDKGSSWSVVHNVYLQIAADLGIPALVVFLLLFGQLIRYVRAVQASSPSGPGGRELASLAGAAEVSLWAYAVAAMFHPVAYQFYFFYIGGFATALHTAHQQLNSRMGAG